MARTTHNGKRILAVLLTLVLCLAFAGCNKKDQGTERVPSDTRNPAGVAADSDLILPYSREEGVNPFSGSSLMNEAIMPLLYDGLYVINEKYEPVPTLVEDVTVNGTTLMLTMNADRRFSDGTVITADDVVYSFNMAKKSVYYGSLLAGLDTATAGGTTTVSFTLSRPNQYILADLTFPVVKTGTADQADSIPVGSGKYVYTASDSGGILNKSSEYRSERFNSEQIYLLNIPDQKTLFSSLNIETVNAAVDDISEGELDRITASTAKAPLNNLVYVGIRENGKLADASIRQAISAVLNRKTFVNSGLSGYADAAELPLNPKWYGLEGVKIKSMEKAKAKELLETEMVDQTLKIVTVEGNTFKEQIANELAKELKAAGVSCEVEALEGRVFRSAVSSGLYDLYVGEYRLTNSMDLSGLLSDPQLESSFASVQSGAASCESFLKAFQKQMPFVPLAFRTGVLAYSRNMEMDVKPIAGNPYANVYEWELT